MLEAFDDYWGGRPPIKRLRFVEVPEVASRVNGLRSGDFDFACDMPPDQIAAIEFNPSLEVVGGPIMNIRLTIFDKHHPTLKDPRVRRAMTHAVDRQAIVDALVDAAAPKYRRGCSGISSARCCSPTGRHRPSIPARPGAC